MLLQPSLEQRCDKRKRAGLTQPEMVKMARLKCDTILTVKHILLNCKKFENSQKNHVKNITSMKNVFDNNECKTILNFLREVQLFEKI